MLNWRFMMASRMAPKLPTPAASVGVAQPAKIEPSTSVIRNAAGAKLQVTRVTSSAVFCGPSCAPSGGARCGFNQLMTMM